MRGLNLRDLSPVHRKAIRDELEQRKRRGATALADVLTAGRAYDSHTEERFAGYLEGARIAGNVLEWRYHPHTFNLTPHLIGPPVTYTPDFGALMRGEIEGPRVGAARSPRWCLFEVKGSWKAKNARDSRTRLRVAAALFPWFRWFAVDSDTGRRWKIAEIGGEEGLDV